MDENFIAEDYIFSPSVPWKYLISLVSLALSLTVNAIVTALIVFRIVKVYREVRPTLEDERSGVSGGASHLRSVIFVIIESGMMLFAIQLFRVCITVLWEVPSFRVVIGINQMLNVMMTYLSYYLFLFTFKLCLGNNTYDYPRAGRHEIVIP